MFYSFGLFLCKIDVNTLAYTMNVNAADNTNLEALKDQAYDAAKADAEKLLGDAVSQDKKIKGVLSSTKASLCQRASMIVSLETICPACSNNICMILSSVLVSSIESS